VPHRTEIVLVGLLAAALTLAVLAGRGQHRAVGSYEPPSTYRSGPTGGRAPYDVLAQLGIPEERRRTPLFDLARQVRRRPAALLVIAPEQPLVPAELEAVGRYVAMGGTLVGVSDAGGLTACLGWMVVRPDSSERHSSDSVPVVLPDGLGRLPAVRWVLGRGLPDSLGGPSKRDIEHGGRLRERRMFRGAAQCTATVSRTDTLLSTQSGSPVLIRVGYRGGGSALLMADDQYFRNAAWRNTDVPELLVPLLDPGGRGKLSWDEYHHGYDTGGSAASAVLGWLARSPVGWALFQLVGVLLVWLGVTAVRFGPPRAVIDRRRRSPLEHVEALAAGLEGADGTQTGVALIVSGLRRRLSRTGRAPHGEARGWLAALELVLPRMAGRRAVRRLQHILTDTGGAERVLGAAQAVEDVWEELRPRATPAGFSKP
jgi:hypothetical protein